MTRTRGAILIGAVVLVAAGAWWIAEGTYFSQARSLRAEIARLERLQSNAQEILDGRAAWAQRRDALGATMIDGATDEFEHTLRTALASVAGRAGLTDVSSGNGRPVAMASPVARHAGRSLRPILRSQPDFSVIHAWLSGNGDLDSVLTALALLESQPWVHRVEGFSIRPANRERTRFDLRVDLASVRMDAVPRTGGALPDLEPISEARRSELAMVIGANPFGTQIAPVETAPPRKVRSPYRDWRITGLIAGDRLEVLLVNRSSGERLMVTPGERVHGATLVSGSGEYAVFEIDGVPHEVRVGDTLNERRPIATEHEEAAAQARAEEAAR